MYGSVENKESSREPCHCLSLPEREDPFAYARERGLRLVWVDLLLGEWKLWCREALEVIEK